MKHSASSIAALAACVLLSACSGGGGGGGVGSTPAPGAGTGTAPAPSPTPAPSTTPTPSPTPTPSSTPNASLLALSNSETFGTDASAIAANYPANSAGTVTASSPTISVAFDAVTGNYTVTSGNRSQIFRPADKDTANSSAQLTILQRTVGDTTDSLTLTNTGTSGPYRYQYVGAGFWQRTVQSGGALSGTVDAFTYGVRTPISAVPRTGLASYAVDLIAVQAYPAELASLAGTGQLDVDFTGGNLSISGSGRSLGLVQGRTVVFDFLGRATLASASNQFTGTMSLSSFGESGSLAGRFYGPGAEEIGATFAATSNTSDGAIRTVGTITGRKNTVNTDTLASVVTPRSFDLITMPLTYYSDSATGLVTSANAGSRNLDTLRFDRSAGSYMLYGTNFTAATLVAAESTARIKTYRVTNGNDVTTLKIYVPTGSSGELVLSYSGFGVYNAQTKPVQGQDGFAFRWFGYGLDTVASALPRSGSASFTGQLYGNAQRPGGSSGYDMRGTGSLTVSFMTGGGGSVSGTLSPVFTPTGGGASFDYGQLSFTGQLPSGLNAFDGPITQAVGATQTFSGYGFGRFFGPNAEEAALQLSGNYKPASGGTPNDQLSVSGVLIARRP
ncbi:hypothetical protein [Sphingomonas elodea]|uniref:hypothetical protein n=1 Tax=Sphingomonas elodea TaxID=179878 RepID=UPI0002D9C7D3|nr:hypothetical protein [Sphingomonas elodea]